jgi:hypothetical protein
MTKTYKNDQSFFTYVKIPSSSYIGLEPVKIWFRESSVARYRLIDDKELANEYANLKTVDEYYPGIIVFTVVINPWARAVVSYKNFRDKLLENNDTLYDVELQSFESYLTGAKNLLGKEKTKNWYNFGTQQKEWIEYKKENNELRTIDIILKLENLENDFKVFQDYFMIDAPLKFELDSDIVNYRDFYNKNTKKIIQNVFAEDIAYFQYRY